MLVTSDIDIYKRVAKIAEAILTASHSLSYCHAVANATQLRGQENCVVPPLFLEDLPLQSLHIPQQLDGKRGGKSIS